MKVFFKELVFSTSQQYQLINITREIEEVVHDSGIKNGICLIYAPHATLSIIINEDEHGLKEDVIEWIKNVFPRNGKWKHNIIDDNASSHLASSFIGSSRTIPIIEGRLYRGTWQEVFLVETDGPRSIRKVLVLVIGE